MLFRSNDTATTEIYTPSDTLSLHDALPIDVPHARVVHTPLTRRASDHLPLVIVGLTLITASRSDYSAGAAGLTREASAAFSSNMCRNRGRNSRSPA